jgi:N-methylhydantoinase A
MLAIETVAAGGGSVCGFDGVKLFVGPQSAGADPGPACYGQGGREPTVTDANLVLGRLDPAYFLGGAMTLEVEAARQVIARVADPLGVSVTDAAAAIVEIAVTSMVHAVHLISTQCGYDVRDFTLVAFGGAGPLHANALAHELGIGRTVVPPSPGIFSALGLLVSDVEHNFVVSRLAAFGELDYDQINAIYAAFEERGHAALAIDGVPEDRATFTRAMEVRYVGQSFPLRVPIPDGSCDPASEALIRERFHDEHERTNGYAARGEPIELVNLRLSAVGQTPKPATRRLEPQVGPVAPRTRRAVFFPDADFVDCPIFDRANIGADARIAGPAIVDQLDSTIVLYPGYSATAREDGSLILEAR